MKHLFFRVIAFVLICWMIGATPSLAVVSATPQSPYWEEIASSRLVVSGTILSVSEDPTTVSGSVKSGSFRLQIQEVLRNDAFPIKPPEQITVRLYNTSFSTLKEAQVNRDYLFFLDGSRLDDTKLSQYFEGDDYDKHPLIPSDSDAAADVKREIRNQQAILHLDFPGMEKASRNYSGLFLPIYGPYSVPAPTGSAW